jgi:hypothetical protein
VRGMTFMKIVEALRTRNFKISHQFPDWRVRVAV